MRLIDGDALLEKAVHFREPELFKHWVNDAPPIEPKQGAWIQNDVWSEGVGMGESYGFYYECSECHKEFKGGYKMCYPFCPNCGAKMVTTELM